jgi:ureidoacrylate peracid hydrolase
MEPTILEKFSDRLASGHTALLIIDMQNDFCLAGYGASRAGRDVSAAAEIVASIASLLAAARSGGVTIAHVGLSTLADHRSDSGPWLAQRRRSSFSSERLCMEGTDGAAFITELSPAAGEWVVMKHRYSAFTGTNLDLLLRSRSIKTVVVTGVSTNACIESTARAAFELEYYVCVPPDCVASWDRRLHDATLANVNHRFGLTPSREEIVGVWDDGGRSQCVVPR